MKRNMDLIRMLLLIAEGSKAAQLWVKKYPEEERLYHAQLLIEEGYVIGLGRPIPGSAFINAVVIERLTWKGHDFLDATRSQEIWRKVQKKALKVGGWTVDLLLDLAKQELKKTML
jgi:hypothetical protein